MNFFYYFIILLGIILVQGENNLIKIESDRITSWGEWKEQEMCPDNSYAIGFDIKYHEFSPDQDNTALNGIKLLCSDLKFTKISSGQGDFGVWRFDIEKSIKKCKNFAKFIGFRMLIQGDSGENDDSSVNQIEMICEDNEYLSYDVQPAVSSGYYTEKRCPTGKAICGLKTQIESKKNQSDNTGLNNADFYCCNAPVRKSIIEIDKMPDFSLLETHVSCPFNSFAIGLSVKVDSLVSKLSFDENVGLKGIKLFCNDAKNTTVNIEKNGDKGKWTDEVYCKKEKRLTGFRILKKGSKLRFKMMQENYQTVYSIQMYCEGGQSLQPGLYGRVGEWSSSKYCPKNQVVCGISSQIDTSGLNNLKFFCCDSKDI